MKIISRTPSLFRGRNKSVLTAFVVTALLALTAVSVLSDTSEAIPGYTIGGTDDLSGSWYPTLDALMEAETIVSGDMITLLGNVTGTKNLRIEGTLAVPIAININLDGYTLTIETTGYGVYIVHGQIDLRGPGTFNITSSNNYGLYCNTGGSFLSNDDTTVNVKGKDGVIVGGSGDGRDKTAYVTNVTATNGDGVLAMNKGTVTVYGNVTATGGVGVSAATEGSKITVDGNVTVNGNHNAVEASIKGDVYVKGNVTATAGTGACVTDSIGEITINGKITAATYIKLDNIALTVTDYNATSYKPGYLEYTEGNAKAWVKMAPFTFTDSPAYDIPASTIGTAIANIDVSPGVSGGALPYTFTANGLPSWATIDNTTGVISGTPTAAAAGGTATIFANDGLSHTASITIDYGAVTAAAAPLTFTHSSAYDIPDSTVGTAIANINVAPGVSGGVTPYAFTATGLPSGITISSAGVISGTPTAAASAGTATVTVTDSLGITKSITIAFGAISESAPEEDSGGGSNTIVIIAVALVAILAIGAVLYFFVLKKKP
ncbi:MAG: putative Ig domain-containing protein [Methanomassiliicoccaceae archaeon]|nr:putative Ig domain-containing protein [Methanomassiliicoccaceae archaeon]